MNLCKAGSFGGLRVAHLLWLLNNQRSDGNLELQRTLLYCRRADNYICEVLLCSKINHIFFFFFLHDYTEKWTTGCSAMGWVAWIRGVYYLQLRNTYFLRCKALPDVLYTKILFASCLPHICVTLGHTQNSCSAAFYTEHLMPAARSLPPSLGSLLTEMAAYIQTRINQKHAYGHLALARTAGTSMVTLQTWHEGALREDAGVGGDACHSSMSSTDTLIDPSWTLWFSHTLIRGVCRHESLPSFLFIGKQQATLLDKQWTRVR